MTALSNNNTVYFTKTAARNSRLILLKKSVSLENQLFVMSQMTLPSHRYTPLGYVVSFKLILCFFFPDWRLATIILIMCVLNITFQIKSWDQHEIPLNYIKDTSA